MVNTKLIEKQPRVFIPYDIIIEVRTEEDHKDLVHSVKSLKDKDSYFYKKAGSLGFLMEQIINHICK